MADFALNPGMEANLVEETLRVAEETIQNDINNLPAEISGHLLPYYGVYPNIRALIQQCDSIGSKHCALVPNFPYANVPGSSLEYTFQTDFVGEFFHLSHEDKYLLSKSRESPYIHRYDMGTGELKQTTFASSGDLYVTPDGKHFVLADHVTERAIKIHRSDNGEFVGQLIVMNHIQLKPKEKYRMKALSLTHSNVCLIVTTEVSYLCIADILTCRFLRIVVLDGRANICKVTPDYKFVFCNSNNFLMCYDLTSLEQKSDKQLPCSPSAIAFTRDASLAYVAGAQECKMYTIELHEGAMGMLYQTVLQDIMAGDKILSLKVAPLDRHVLVHGHSTVLVYDRIQEMICCYFQKPGEIPRDFKLPKGQNYDLDFTNANFSRDGNFIIATMFRNVYIWQIATSSLVTVIQTPVGIIADLVVSHRRNQLITHLKGSTEMQVWNLSEALNQICMPDRMTGVISDIKVTQDASLAYVTCKNSEDIALIDMAYGTMIYYLTHERKIESFAITPTGDHLLVATKPRRQDTAVRLWNMMERTVVKEFGNADGYCIGANLTATLIFVGQDNISFKAPHYITIFFCDTNPVSEIKLPHVVKYVLDKPFVTSDDKYIIFLTAQDYVESKSIYDTPTICVCTLENNSKMDCYTPSSFQNAAEMETILDVRSCSSQPSVIAVIFVSLAVPAIKEETASYDRDAGEYYGHYGVLLFDVSNGAILSVCDPFMRPDVPIDGQLVFSKDFKFCLDKECNIYDLINMEYCGWLSNLCGPPRAIALDGKVVVTYRGSHIHAVRLEDGKTIARCDVHAEIRSITLCTDDRTLVIGCDNGTIVSYVLLDAEDGDNEQITGTLFSRRYASQVKTKEITPRSRDRISSNGKKRYTGSASRRCGTPSDKKLVNQVKSLPRLRPNSDTLLYINNTTRTCSLM